MDHFTMPTTVILLFRVITPLAELKKNILNIFHTVFSAQYFTFHTADNLLQQQVA